MAAFAVILGDLAKGVLEDIGADVLSGLFPDSSTSDFDTIVSDLKSLLQAQSFADTYESCEADWNLAIQQNLPDYENLKQVGTAYDQLISFLQSNLLDPLNEGVSVLETLNLDCTNIGIAQSEGIGALNLYALFGNSRLTIYQEMANVYSAADPGEPVPYANDYQQKAQEAYTFGNNMLQTILTTRRNAISPTPTYDVIRVGGGWSLEGNYYFSDAWTNQTDLGNVTCDEMSESSKELAQQKCQGDIDQYIGSNMLQLNDSLQSVQQSLTAWNTIANPAS